MVLSNKEWLDKMNEIISAIKNGGGDSQVIEDMLSNMWISSATYNVGDYVLYDNNIWKCLVQNSNIAPTEGSTWTSVKITDEISTLNSNLEKTKQNFYFPSNSIVNITFGNYKTSAIIFVCLSDADAVLYVYSNGYLANIKSSPIVNVTLSSDFKTITLKNNSSASNGYLGILQTGDTTLTIA